MTGYTVLAGALIFFLLFIYATWFGTELKEKVNILFQKIKWKK